MAVSQHQIEYLNEMGIPVWISRGLEVPESISQVPQGAVANVVSAERVVEHAPASPSSLHSTGSHISSLTADLESQDARIPAKPANDRSPDKSSAPKTAVAGLHAANDLIRDLQQKNPAGKIAEIAASLDDEPVAKAPVSLVPVEELELLGLSELQQTVMACTACDLHNKRQQTVFGRGNNQAQWMIVGDIPRLEDEWAQQPFTGESGELLDAMLASIGVDSSLVYMTNLLKCRPPLDRSPDQEQAASCLSYLKRQIELVNPALIILMGRDTVRQVLGGSQSMASLRQQVHQRDGISAPLVATYHPTYLLKQPRLKAQVWQDLQFAKQAML